MSRKESTSYSSRTSGLTNNEPQPSSRTSEIKLNKGTSDSSSDKCLYDSRLSDSGVWSGSNIQTEEISYPESPNSKSSEFTFSSDKVLSENKSYMRLDSGIDVSVSQQFSELNLKESSDDCSCLNDLSAKSGSRETTKSTNLNDQFPDSPKTVQKPQLEAYFQQNEDGDTQLHLAIIHKFIEVVYDLVRMAPHPDYLNIRNEDRQTPLHLAVLTGQPRLVRLLVCAGASLDSLDREGNTALHLAVQADDLQSVRAIIDPVKTPEVDAIHLKYRPYAFHLHTDIANIHNYSGLTCVHLAAQNGSVEVLRYLLWYGADINAKEWKSGQTCLHMAVEAKDAALCIFLLAQQGLDADEMDYAGYTAYQTAYAAWDKEIVSALRDHGVDTYVPSDAESEDSDQEMVDLSDNSYSGKFSLNGGLVNVGA